MKNTFRIIKLSIILLLPILIITLSFPYINTNELKAEEVSLEDFDDSPSGNVKITHAGSYSVGQGVFAFISELHEDNSGGNLYIYKNPETAMLDKNLRGNGGDMEPILGITRVETPTSTSEKREYLSGIIDVQMGGMYANNADVTPQIVLAKDYNNNYYLFGDKKKMCIPLSAGIDCDPNVYLRPKRLDFSSFTNEEVIDVKMNTSSGRVVLFYYTDKGNIYMSRSSSSNEGIKKISFKNPVTNEDEKIIDFSMIEDEWVLIYAKSENYIYELRRTAADDQPYPYILYDTNGSDYLNASTYSFIDFLGFGNKIKVLYNNVDNSILYIDPIKNYGYSKRYPLPLIKNDSPTAYREANLNFTQYTNGIPPYMPSFLSDELFDKKIKSMSQASATKAIGFSGHYGFITSEGIPYLIYKGTLNTLSDSSVLPYSEGDLPDNYNRAKEFIISGDTNNMADTLLISESGAVYGNGKKIKFYTDTYINAKKIESNSVYSDGMKYNGSVEVTLGKTEGLNRGDLFYQITDKITGQINEYSVSEESLTMQFDIVEGNNTKKEIKTFIKAKNTDTGEMEVIGSSDATMTIDVYKKDMSVTGIENNKSYNTATITWDENNGIADNPISVTMTKDGSAYEYTKGTAINEQGSYTLTATDTYGNTKTYAFNILGPDDSLGLNFTKTSSGTLEYDNAITKANAQIGTVSLIFGEDASTPGIIDLTSTSISAGNDDGYFSIDGDKINVEKDLPAGTYTLTIDGKDSNGTSFSHTVEIVIAQKNITLSLSVSEMIYGDTLTIGADEVSGLPAGFTPVIVLKSDGESMGTYVDDVFTPSKAGTATFTISATDPNGNYAFTGGDQSVVVKPKSVTLSLTQAISKYPGQSLSKLTPSASDNYTITPALINGDTLSGTASYAYVSGSDASQGGTKIKVKITGLSNDNYTIREEPMELTVLNGDTIEEGWYTITGTKKTGFDWYSSDVTIAIDAAKSGDYDLISKDGSFDGASNAFTLNTDEEHELSIQMKDSDSGKLTQSTAETIKIDRVTPSFTISGKAGNQAVTSGTETKGPLTLSGTLTSVNASSITYYYTTNALDSTSSPVEDASKWSVVPDQGLIVSSEGKNTYYMKAVSGAGLVSNLQQYTVNINNDITTPSTIQWSDGKSEQDLIYGSSLSLQISGLTNEEVVYTIIEGDTSKAALDRDAQSLTANSGTGTIKVQAKIKGYKEPLVKTITLKKKDLTIKTQITNKDSVSIVLNGTLPSQDEFGITSSDLVGSDTIALISSVAYEYRNDAGSVITPSTNVKGTYKLYAKITSSLDNYTIKTITPAIVSVGGDITYSDLNVQVEYLSNGSYVPYTSGTWTNKEIRFTLQGGIEDVNKITGYEYIISSTTPSMDDPNWASISDGAQKIHTVTQDHKNATYWFRVTPVADGAKVSKKTVINLDTQSPDIPTIVIKEKPRNAVQKALNAISFNAWFKQEVEVSFTSADQGSGVKEITYEERTDKGSTSHTIPYGTTITYDSDMAGYIKAKAIDQAGNISGFGSETELAIDLNAPVIKGVQDQKEYKQYYVPRFVTVTDSGSGLKQATYKKDNSPEQPFTDNVEEKIKGEGSYKIYAVDEAGNEITLTFKIVSLPDIKTEIDGTDESKEIIDQIIKELDEVKDKIDQNEKENYDKWIEDATDKWNDLRKKVLEDQETTSKVEGQDDTTFDPKTELIVEEIPKDQVPVLPKHAIKTYDVYLMKGKEQIQPDGSVTVPDGGTVIFPDKEVPAPDGAIIHPDGSVDFPDGSHLDPDGNETTKPDPTPNPDDGTDGDTPNPDDGNNPDNNHPDPNPDDGKGDGDHSQICVPGPDGKPGTKDDVCTEGNGNDQPDQGDDGTINVPDGGTVIFPDGSEVELPDGGTIKPNGSVELPDGSELNPDGTKKDPDKKRECKIKGIKINVDSDGDGLPDINLDIDNDCVADLNIDMDNDAIPDLNIDTKGDGKPDLNVDTDTDGEAEVNLKTLSTWEPNLDASINGFAYDTMSHISPDLNVDTDGDGIADVNIDSDGDGIADTNVINGTSQGNSSDVMGGSNTADSTKWTIWLFMVIMTISTMIYSIYRKHKRV